MVITTNYTGAHLLFVRCLFVYLHSVNLSGCGSDSLNISVNVICH